MNRLARLIALGSFLVVSTVTYAAISDPVKIDTGMVSGRQEQIPTCESIVEFPMRHHPWAICAGELLRPRLIGTACVRPTSSALNACRPVAEPKTRMLRDFKQNGRYSKS